MNAETSFRDNLSIIGQESIQVPAFFWAYQLTNQQWPGPVSLWALMSLQMRCQFKVALAASEICKISNFYRKFPKEGSVYYENVQEMWMCYNEVLFVYQREKLNFSYSKSSVNS